MNLGLTSFNYNNGPSGSLSRPVPERIGSAVIRPNGTNSYQIPADLMSDGQIWQKGLDGFQKIGQVDTQGNFALQNGKVGNVYQGSMLGLSYNDTINVLSTPQPLARILLETERNRAVTGSEIPLIRNHLTRVGLNGQGLKVGILDPWRKDSNGEWAMNDHSKSVSQIINDPVWGVAPGAQVVDKGAPFEQNPPIIKSDQIRDFVSNLTADRRALYNYFEDRINQVVQTKEPGLRVLNITYGESDFELLTRVLKDLNQRDEQGYFKYPVLRAALYGNSSAMGEARQLKTVINNIQSILKNSPIVQQAAQNYVAATKNAAQNGIIIVEAMGNDQGQAPENLVYEPGYFMDTLVKSPYVIRSAASNTNQTPGLYQDDQVTSFSARGDDYFNPTVAAPGEEVGVGYPNGVLNHNLVTQGTSFSTPFTCGVVALMLQRNPFLSFDQVKAKLQDTAVKSPYYGPADYGAGFLNPVAAVLS